MRVGCLRLGLLIFILRGGNLRAETQEPIPFSFTQKPLVELLEKVVPRGTILILPQNASDLETLSKQRATYLPQDPLTSRRAAWSLINTLLELSGFSAATHNNQVIVMRNESVQGGALNRAVVPVYVGILPDIHKQDDSRIRYIHYLKNLRVPRLSEKENHPLTKMISSFLSPNASLIFDPSSNAVIMTDKAFHVAAVADLLTEFDSRGVKEQVTYIPLNHVPAQDVVAVLNSLKSAAGSSAAEHSFATNTPHTDPLTVLSEDTRIIADPIRNGVILMGRQANVERVGEFIRESLDRAQQTGTSILHYYNLQFLDNVECAAVLERLVSSTPSESQATETNEKSFFKGVAIAAEVPLSKKSSSEESEGAKLTLKGSEEVVGLQESPPTAGNRLIIAARQTEWLAIEKLLQQLDQPQPQVFFELVFVEFLYDHHTIASGTNRSKTDASLLPNGVQYLASHITPVSSVLGSNPTQLAQDLLAVIGPTSVPSQAPIGSVILSINDRKTPGIFALLEVLDSVISSRVNAYPSITISNNKKGSIDSSVIKRGPGDLVTTTNGTSTIPTDDIPATVNVTATPHIVSDDRLRLSIEITIEEFTGVQDNRVSRELKTTATLNSGEILALGGLIRTDSRGTESKTPLLASIPLIGAFFRGTNKETIKTNLTIFIMPTIITKKRHHTWTEKTKGYLCKTPLTDTFPRPSDERDPVSHLFFTRQKDEVQQFLGESSNMELFDIKECEEPKLMRTPSPTKQLRPYNPEKLKRTLALSRQRIPHLHSYQSAAA